MKLTYRTGTGTSLTYQQLDDNFRTIEVTVNALLLAPSGTGTVTQVTAGDLSGVFTTGVATNTTTPAISFTLAQQTQNKVFASLASGTGAPTFRALVSNDLPTVTVTKGGTNLTALPTTGYVLSSNGSTYVGRQFIAGSNKLTIAVNTSDYTFNVNESNLTLSNLAGILTTAKGGTGVTTAANGQLLIGNGTGFGLANITAGSNVTITNSAGGITISSSGSGGVSSVNTLTGDLFINAGSAGSDFAVNASGANITLNIPTATGTKRGLLSSTDWSTFNNKMGSGLTSANIFVGNGSNVATGVALSGDATISNTGALTIANNAITSVKIASSAVDLTTKVTGTLPVGNGGTGLAAVGTNGYYLKSTGTALTYSDFSADVTAIVNAVANKPMQVHTTGSTVTITAGNAGIYIDPTIAIDDLTITFPTSPTDLQEAILAFGGTITSGAVVGNVTLASSATIILPITGEADAGKSAVYKYRSANTTWNRIA